MKVVHNLLLRMKILDGVVFKFFLGWKGSSIAGAYQPHLDTSLIHLQVSWECATKSSTFSVRIWASLSPNKKKLETSIATSWSPMCPRFAIFLNTAGGAWDNAKKYIEQGWQRKKCERDLDVAWCIWQFLMLSEVENHNSWFFGPVHEWGNLLFQDHHLNVKWPESGFWEPWQWKNLSGWSRSHINRWMPSSFH